MRRALVLSSLALAALAGGARAARPAAAGSHDWPMFGADPGRSSASAAPAGIDARQLGSLSRRQVQLDGTVDASPIYLRGVSIGGASHDALFVTTTYGKTLAIDAHSGAVLWEYTPPGYGTWAGTYQITTATPVADPDRTAIYAASPDGRIQKLAVADGHALWRTAITRLPAREKIASALNLFDGRVIAATGGYLGDRPPYQGHVAIVDAATGRLRHVWNALCSDRAGLLDPRQCPSSHAAIWGRAGVVVDAGTGELFVATGNGPWNGRTAWGDSVVELDRDATRVLGSFTPANQAELRARDLDVGSTSPVLLGGGWLVQGGKDGVLRLLAIARLAGTAPHRGGEAQRQPTPGGAALFTAPAVMHDASGTWLFVADGGGVAAWRLRGGRLARAWQHGRGGTSPVVAGGLLYVYDPLGALVVYEPATGRRLATLPCGQGHWNSPIVVDGTIALPEGNANQHATTGVLDLWHARAASP